MDDPADEQRATQQPSAAGVARSGPGASRRSRRAVRHAGTVGTDDSVLRSTHPALGTAADEAPAPSAEVTSEVPREPALPLRSLDDSDVGWGHEPDANDDRLRRDRPPHW